MPQDIRCGALCKIAFNELPFRFHGWPGGTGSSGTEMRTNGARHPATTPSQLHGRRPGSMMEPNNLFYIDISEQCTKFALIKFRLWRARRAIQQNSASLHPGLEFRAGCQMNMQTARLYGIAFAFAFVRAKWGRNQWNYHSGAIQSSLTAH